MKTYIFAVFYKDRFLKNIEVKAKDIESAYDRAIEDAIADIMVEERGEV